MIAIGTFRSRGARVYRVSREGNVGVSDNNSKTALMRPIFHNLDSNV